MATISGGDKLETMLTAIAKRLDKAESVSVGFLAGATYPDGTPVAMVAAIQEFGAPAANILPRPFFRNMIAKNSGSWPRAIAAAMKSDDYDAEVVLGRLGAVIQGQLEQSIVDTNDPALSQLTLAIRKWKEKHPDQKIGGRLIGKIAAMLAEGKIDTSGVSTKPLVETGFMLSRVDYRVE